MKKHAVWLDRQNRLLRAGFFTPFALILLCFGLGCSSLSNSKDDPLPITLKKPLLLRLGQSTKHREVTKAHSYSQQLVREGGQLTREREEIVDFVVDTQVKPVTEKNETFEQVVTVTEKDGPVNLHDMGYPEVGETLPFKLTTRGVVLQAGNYPSDSVFFVPPIFFPEETVRIGDTWVLTVEWKSQQGVPLVADLVFILRQAYTCGKAGPCVEIAVNGEVNIDSLVDPQIQLSSLIDGRFLFSMGHGTILWSLMHNNESIGDGQDEMSIYSCLETWLVEPTSWRWPHGSSQTPCEDKSSEKVHVPGTN